MSFSKSTGDDNPSFVESETDNDVIKGLNNLVAANIESSDNTVVQNLLNQEPVVISEVTSDLDKFNRDYPHSHTILLSRNHENADKNQERDTKYYTVEGSTSAEEREDDTDVDTQAAKSRGPIASMLEDSPVVRKLELPVRRTERVHFNVGSSDTDEEAADSTMNSRHLGRRYTDFVESMQSSNTEKFLEYRSGVAGPKRLSKPEMIRFSNTGNAVVLTKKAVDHTPHDMYVQMDIMSENAQSGKLVWQQKYRWIKYEQEAEQCATRWGKPHMASMTFHSLMYICHCLERGIVMFDVDAITFQELAQKIYEGFIDGNHIDPSHEEAFMRVMTAERLPVEHHHHGVSYGRRHRIAKHESAGYVSEVVDSDGAKGASSPHISDFATSDENEEMSHDNIMKHLAPEIEACSVNVGVVDFLEKPVTVFLRLSQPRRFAKLIDISIPVRFVFILLGPENAEESYNEIGRSFSTLMSSSVFKPIAYQAEVKEDLSWALKQFLEESIVLPPLISKSRDTVDVTELRQRARNIQERKRIRTERLKSIVDIPKNLVDKKSLSELPDVALLALTTSSSQFELEQAPFDNNDDPLIRRGKPFAGFVNDLKRRYPKYLSDFTDGLNTTVISSIFFMFFAVLAGAITFGGLMMDKTENQVGISETLISSSVAGIVFSLASCQPLIIVGTTGPVLLFDEALFQVLQTLDEEFLTVRVWIAIWMVVIVLVVVAMEASAYVKVLTLFTTDIFSSLVAILFVFESVLKLVIIFQEHPLVTVYANSTFFNNSQSTQQQTNSSSIAVTGTVAEFDKRVNQPNTALFSAALMFGTFLIAYLLRIFRNSKFLDRHFRRAIGDFGVPIAILCMVSLARLIPHVYTETLSVPDGLTPTNSSARGWFISPFGLRAPIGWRTQLLAVPGACFLFIIIFLETMVCQAILAKPERRLTKGSGFHSDILFITLLNLFTALIGAPWLCAATIRSLSHVAALGTTSANYAPGESPQITGAYEQRVSTLFVSILLALSITVSSIFSYVPKAVIFGIFFYMGVSSMNGIQFLDRFVLLFMPPKHHPNESYVKRVTTKKMHMYTIIQLVCLILLVSIKFTDIAILFPCFLALLIPLRSYVLPHIFAVEELSALDGGTEPDEIQEDEPDFYMESHRMPSIGSHGHLIRGTTSLTQATL